MLELAIVLVVHGEAQPESDYLAKVRRLAQSKKGDDKKPVVSYDGKQDQDSNPAQQHDNNVQDANAQPQKHLNSLRQSMIC